MKMSRRIYRVLVPLVAALGLVVGIAAPAGATGHRITPSINNCKYELWWWDGSATGYHVYLQYAVMQPDYPYDYGVRCTTHFQVKVLCGVYGIPSTYYWYIDAQRWATNATWAGWGGSNWEICPVWGNDIALNLVIVDAIYGALLACWSENAGNWVYNRSDVPCYFQ